MQRTKHPTVTMKDIARKAHVAVSAVSYALNNNGSVSEEKKNRILALVKRYGYRPDRVARSLKTRTTRTVGVMTDLRHFGLRARILEGISREAAARGYSIVLIDDTGDHEKAMEILVGDRVSGIVYLSYKPEEFNKSYALDVPIVFAYCYDAAYHDSCVVHDDVQGGYIISRHLVELGHRPIAAITGPRSWKPVQDMMKGYRRALREAGIAFDPTLVVQGDYEDRELNDRAARTLLSRSPRPRAVFAFADLIAVSVYGAAHELGLAIPEDVAVGGHGDREYAEYLIPKLTTVAMPLHEIGRRAGELLFRKIEGEAVAAEPTPSAPLECRLIVRGSCGARR
jgi:LacI family transcriptional regulator